ncbi:DUF998 domain-containing protein [Microbacterium thalassium]|uniref:Putative membrane protein n=1 Tax=Microbacterium thalassium TaxID=362649 RepID=A0A7X0FMX8_9MICO|nr:DUF998 domain-containing protein [Microbacterium thalassium]MBB6390443.1 putative membrane protein [Microbacterium thalassium]GLK25552.1 hypothetical protein GCM10017607_28710 [Microbacterium thalassium]
MSESSTAAAASAPSVAQEFDATSARSLESLSLSVGVIAFVVIALVALPVFRLGEAPITGPGSIGQYVAISSGAVGFVSFFAGRLVMRGTGGPSRLSVLDYLDVAMLSLAHGIIALLSWTLIAHLLEAGFIGASVFAVALLVLSGSAAAVTAYVCFYSATHMDMHLLSIVLAVFLVEGVLASMLTASDPSWWKDNLSALGMTDDLSSMAFNVTLIVAGFIVTTLARYATVSIPTPHPHGRLYVRILLIVVGVFLACVGIFPVNEYFALHNTVATGMAVAFVVLAIGLRWWVPGVPRAFITLGWVFIAVIVVLAVFFAVGVYTLTAVELVAGILVFAWIVLFIRNAGALRTDAAAEASAAQARPADETAAGVPA